MDGERTCAGSVALLLPAPAAAVPMNIGYLCMDPNAARSRSNYAPIIHITETIRSLESQGHTVASFLFGDMLGRSETAVRQRLKPTNQPPAIVRWGRRFASDALLAAQDLVRHKQLIESFLLDNSIEAGYERLYQPRSIVTRTASKLGVPVVVESNSPAEERRAYWGSPLHGLIERKEVATLKRAAAVVAISSPLKDHYVRRGVAPSKIHVVPNGVDALRFSPDAVARDMRSELGLDGCLVVGFVGNIHPYHGAELFIPLAKQLQAAREDARLLIVGAGSGLSELERALDAADLGSYVLTTGPVPHADVPAYIASMDIGLLPDFSWYGSAMKLLEYAAMGTTVVAPDLENIRDVFTHGETAYLFPRGDIAGLARAIHELGADAALRRKLGRAARQHVLANHTWSLNGERIAAIVESVAH